MFSFRCGIAQACREQDKHSAACRRFVAEGLVCEVAVVVVAESLVRKGAVVVVPESLMREGSFRSATVASPKQPLAASTIASLLMREGSFRIATVASPKQPLAASTIASLFEQALPQHAKRQRHRRRHRQGKRNGLPSLFGLLLHKRKI